MIIVVLSLITILPSDRIACASLLSAVYVFIVITILPSDRIACASLLSAVYAAGVTSVDNILCHLSISTR